MSTVNRLGTEDEGLIRFIRLTFRSAWTVELLLLLHSHPDRDWTRDQLIQSLRASEQVLSRSIEDLAGAGLIREEDGFIRYGCDASTINDTVAAVLQLYTSHPATVRRLIAGGGADDQLTRFAAAFRLRGGSQ